MNTDVESFFYYIVLVFSLFVSSVRSVYYLLEWCIGLSIEFVSSKCVLGVVRGRACVTIARAQGGGGGERRAGRGKRPSGSSTSGSLGRGALSDPDLQSRLQPNLNAYWVRTFKKYWPPCMATLLISLNTTVCNDGLLKNANPRSWLVNAHGLKLGYV